MAEIPKRLKGTWWDTPQTYETLAAITVPTIEKRALELTPWEWLQLSHVFIGTDGTPNLTQDTTGRMPVVEQNSSTVATHTQLQRYQVGEAHFGVLDRSSSSSGLMGNYAYRLLCASFTATAGGEIAAADLVAAVAGYQSCCIITSVWSDQTDASISCTIDSSSGNDKGPTTWALATTANAVTNYSPGVSMRASTDNEAIQLSCAAGQAQANQVLWVMGYYWYET